MHTKQQIMEILEGVNDPELGMSIIDLGLVYDVTVKEDGKVNILMTLTTIGCPLFGVIETEVKNKVSELHIPPEDVTIELTFDPPWSMERMTERAKAMLGI